MKDRVPTISFLASTVFLSIAYGIFAERWQWFPARQVTEAEATILDVSANWKNDLALEPTRHLVEGYRKDRADDDSGFTLYEPDRVDPGYTMIAGLSRDQPTSAFSVTLYDEEGQPSHVWPVDYDKLDPDGPNPLNVMLHGMEVFPDGSIAVSFDAGNVIARLDACGEPMWIQRGGFHHSITRDEKGGVWAWRDNVITRLDENTGEVTKTLSLPDQILSAGAGQYGVFAVRSFASGGDGPLTYAPDPFHANDVEPLLASMADAFPDFREGDLLISLREINLLAVIDQDTGELRWWRHGPWLKQHDPDFQPDGTITVFDNATGTSSSKIRRIKPSTNVEEILFEGNASSPFSSWQRGKHQMLPNGDVLVTEAQHGRVFEAEPDGKLVWEREMVWDTDRNLIVTEARHLSPNFFNQAIPTCNVTSDLKG